MQAMSDYQWWKRGTSELMKAATSGDADAVTAVLDDGIAPNSSIAGGITALMIAASSGHLATVHALLAKGADVNAQNNAGGTALMYAATGGYAETVKTLLRGSNVNAQTRMD